MKPIALWLAAFAVLFGAGAQERLPEGRSGPAADRGAPVGLDTSRNAFGRGLDNLGHDSWMAMRAGKRVFGHRFRAAGKGPAGLDGLGPLYNSDSCFGCHFKDGRGGPPEDPPAPHPPLLFRLGVRLPPTPGPVFSPRLAPDPELGGQLQDRSLEGDPEGTVGVTYDLLQGSYPDGTPFELRRPRYELRLTSPRQPEALPLISPRIPPTLVGMGLLEAVEPAEILLWADAADRDGDGISGRPRWLPPNGDHRPGDPLNQRLGRFGWRAGAASLEEQSVAALAEDMGVTAPRTAAAADEGHQEPAPAELAPEQLAALVAYLQTLGPPPRRDDDSPEVIRGERLFLAAGCESCHRSRLMTGPAHLIPGPAELAQQEIRPYTDLLLHDLGPGLADGLAEGGGEGGTAVSGREWRTAPLWGLGLLEAVNGTAYFLHDGRARTFEEAVLWHEGEAAASRDHFMSLSAAERRDLLRFLESL